MATTRADEPGALQDAQYRFPYHYLPRMEAGRFRFHEVLDWGHEYLSYMTHVADVLRQFNWKSVLDVGCGDGRLPSLLTARFPERRVVGLDYSERAIALASAMVPEAEFIAGDVTDPKLFAEPFDCATCIDTIEHIEPAFLPEFVRGIRLQVKAGATLVVTVPSTNVKVNRKHYQHFSGDTLTSVLSPSFEVEEVRYLNGSSALLRALRMVLTNRIYTVTHPTLLTAFYKFYVRNFLASDGRRGGRVLAICRAR